jgi:hypothetical protein
MMTSGGLNLQRPADGEAALAVTLGWLRESDSSDEFFAPALRPLEISGAPGTLAERLAAAGFVAWRDAIVAAAGSGQPLHLEPRLEWLMSQAALEVAVQARHPGLFRAVDELQTLGRVSDAALASAVCSSLAGVAEGYPLLARLQTRLKMLWDSSFNARMRGYVEAVANRPLTSRDLWPRHDGMPIGDGWAHRVAATLWPDRYMEMLASFPAPFQHGFADPLLPLDLELVASLVHASPAVFSREGAPLGPVVVFVLFEAIEAHLAAVAVQDLPAAQAGVGRILDAVFSRSDGDWIGRTWLQQIIWRDTPRRAGRPQAEVEAQRVLRDTLLAQLSTRISPLSEAELFDWVRQEQPLWAVHRVLSQASILEAHGDAVAAAEVLAEAIRRGLVSATGRPAGLITNSPEAIVVARVLSQLPDVKRWFEALWRDTYHLREHLSYPAHRDSDNPAYPALAWGLNVLNRSQTTPIDTAGFWRVIGNAVFETQRIDPNASLFNGPMPPITRITVQLGAALAERGVLPIGDLANFLVDQLEPTTEHARLWQIARSEASDNVTLATGRLVGAALLRQALEAGLAQHLPGRDAVLDRSARDDLADFSSRL